MKVALVLDSFPILSESFILRLIEGVSESDSIKLFLFISERYDPILLRKLSPSLFSKIENGQVTVCYGFISNSHKSLSGLFFVLKCIFKLMLSPLSLLKLLKSGSISFRYLFQATSIARFSRLYKPDLLHGQFLTTSLSIIASKSLGAPLGAKVISSMRGYDISRNGVMTDNRVHYLTYENGGLSRILGVSESLNKIALKKGFPGELLTTVYSGLAISKLPFRLPSKNLPSSSLRLIQVGRLVEKKGFELTIQAVAQMARDGKCTLKIVGDGPLRTHLENQVSSLGLTKAITFTGSVKHSEVLELMSASDILLTPSMQGLNGDSEGIPNVTKEGMALGVINVASDHSGIPELVMDGVTGFLFKEGNSEDYLAAIERAKHNLARWDEVSENARAHVQNNFDLRITTQLTLQHYLN